MYVPTVYEFLPELNVLIFVFVSVSTVSLRCQTSFVTYYVPLSFWTIIIILLLIKCPISRI